jgi:uridine kinase
MYTPLLFASSATPPLISQGNWIRIRNSGGHYKLLFQAEVREPPFLISPRVQFLINVKVLGGLMALGYETSAILHRTSTSFKKDGVRVSFIRIDELPHSFVQIRGTDREVCAQ